MVTSFNFGLSLIYTYPLMKKIYTYYKYSRQITQQMMQYSNYTILLCGDFNRDIAFISRHHDNIFISPQKIMKLQKHYQQPPPHMNHYKHFNYKIKG